MRELVARPLTAEAFAPYGDVIEVCADPLSINQGQTERHHDLARVDLGEGRVCVSVFRSTPLERLELSMMERHPHGSQAFMPLSGRPYLVVVAPPGPLRAEAIAAFLARVTKG